MIPDPEKEPVEGMYFGGDTKFDPWSEARGRLTAFDAATGKQKWSYTASKPVIGGVAASGGDLLFAGELSGDFRVFDGRDGKILYTRNVGGSHRRRTRQLRGGGASACSRCFGFCRDLQQDCPRPWWLKSDHYGVRTETVIVRLFRR